MKLKALLVLSIALNAYLAYLAFRTPRSPVLAVVRPTPPVHSYAQPSQTNTSPRQFNWQSVEADDYQIYIANLRAIGCPEETIQDIVIADVFKLFEEKKRQLRSTLPKIEYWKTSIHAGWTLQNDAIEAYHKLSQPIDAQRNQLLRSLGIEPAAHKLPESKFETRELLLDFLPTEKRAQILLAYDRLNEDINALRANLPPEERGRAYEKLRRESDQRIKVLLNPEEALQYDLRFSTTANAMRSTLRGFEPTEAEFIEIFKLRKPYDDAQNFEISERGGVPIEKVQANKDALDQQIKNLLGESRFAEYDRTGDYGFQQLYKFVHQSGQPTSTAATAFEIQRAALQKAYDLRQSDLDKAALDRALNAIRDETESTLQSTLGAATWQNYLKNGFAENWLTAIARRDPLR